MNAPIPTVTRKRSWPPALLVVLGVMAAIGVAVTALVVWALAGIVDAPISVVVNGTEHWPPMALGTLPPGHKVVLLLGLALAALALVVVVPVALLLGLGGALIGVVFGVGLPLLVALAVLALLVSPLVLLGWGLWALLRPARNASDASASAATTMRA